MSLWTRRYCLRRLRGQQGSGALFTIAALLPFLFLLFTLSFDLGTYYLETQKDQKVLDDAALYAYHFMPYQQAVSEAASKYLARYPTLSGLATVSARPDLDQLELNFTKKVDLTFARLFGVNVQIDLAAKSRARGTPFDSLIVMDASPYLAPDINVAYLEQDAWGDAGAWPAAQFFANEYPLTRDGGQIEIDARVVTQQCFNPAFTYLKLATLRVYEYLASFGMNAIGVGFFPSDGFFFAKVREIVSPEVRPIGLGESDFNLYRGPLNANVLCAAAAEREHSHSAYQFPAGDQRLERQEWYSPPGRPASMIIPQVWEYDPAYTPYQRTREVIWSQAIRDGHRPNTPEVLENLRAALITAAFQGNRGGLVNRTLKTGIIFAGDVPYAIDLATQTLHRFPDPFVTNALSLQLNALKGDVALYGDLNVKLYYIVFAHTGNQRPNFENEITQLSAFFDQASRDSQGNRLERFDIQFIYEPSPAALVEQLAPVLVFDKKTAVLAR